MGEMLARVPQVGERVHHVAAQLDRFIVSAEFFAPQTRTWHVVVCTGWRAPEDVKAIRVRESSIVGVPWEDVTDASPLYPNTDSVSLPSVSGEPAEEN